MSESSMTDNQTMIMLKLIKSKLESGDQNGTLKIIRNMIRQLENKEKIKLTI